MREVTQISDPALPSRSDESSIPELEAEVARRRTFAIISHPDAGKTTLTEKLLLYAGAIELAGAVRGRKARRHATSDWMELEQERGISITSAALEFELEGRRMSLLDTPGHKDFSEDTYRALIAADSVVMVIDAANGVEEQTRKLFEVCRRHRLPILTFINKLDRPARDPLELLDDLERTLGIAAAPVNWPIGSAERFRGVYDIHRKHLLVYEREAQGQYRAPVDMSSLDDPAAREMIGEERVRAVSRVARRDRRRRHAVRCRCVPRRDADARLFRQRVDELRPRAVSAGARRARAVAAAAAERFGRREPDRRTLQRLRVQDSGEHGPAPSRPRRVRPRLLRPLHEGHDAREQPRRKAAAGVARVPILRPRPRDDRASRTPATSSASSTRASSRSATRCIPARRCKFVGVPRFPAEHFGRVRLQDTRYKQFDEGLRQLEEEGLMQVFYVTAGRREPIVGVVGALQFDVITSRLQTEYNVSVEIEPAVYTVARWVADPLQTIPSLGGQTALAADRQRAARAALRVRVGAAVLRSASIRASSSSPSRQRDAGLKSCATNVSLALCGAGL